MYIYRKPNLEQRHVLLRMTGLLMPWYLSRTHPPACDTECMGPPLYRTSMGACPRLSIKGRDLYRDE